MDKEAQKIKQVFDFLFKKHRMELEEGEMFFSKKYKIMYYSYENMTVYFYSSNKVYTKYREDYTCINC